MREASSAETPATGWRTEAHQPPDPQSWGWFQGAGGHPQFPRQEMLSCTSQVLLSLMCPLPPRKRECYDGAAGCCREFEGVPQFTSFSSPMIGGSEGVECPAA